MIIFKFLSKREKGQAAPEKDSPQVENHEEASGIPTREAEYLRRFIKGSGFSPRSGKTVYIRREYHGRIKRIVSIIGKDRLTLSDYIDNVLARHFEEHGDAIRGLYRKKYPELY